MTSVSFAPCRLEAMFVRIISPTSPVSAVIPGVGLAVADLRSSSCILAISAFVDDWALDIFGWSGDWVVCCGCGWGAGGVMVPKAVSMSPSAQPELRSAASISARENPASVFWRI